MIIAIALQDNTLNSLVYPQFGRCPWFAIYNSRLDTLTYLKNAEQDTLTDAGITVASFLLAEGVSKVVAGRFGLKAADYLREKQIQMIVPHKEDTILDDILKKISSGR